MGKKNRKQRKEEEAKKFVKRGFFGALFHLIFKFIMFFIKGFLVSLLLAGVIGFFTYNYYPIKTFDLCVNRTATISNIDCTSNSECLTNLMNQSQNQMPDIVKNFMSKLMSEYVICNKKCEVRMPRGFDQPAGDCGADEEPRQLKLYIKDILPPNQIIPTVQQFITTGKIPFSQ